jgi:Vitamin K-dependent gamma-carboxylase
MHVALREASATEREPRDGPRASAEPATLRATWSRRLLEHVVGVYLTADLRSLAAGRIVMALVLLLDLGKRWVNLGAWYTNEGLVPNHTLLWRPSYTHEVSLFYLASYPHEAVIGFVLCALAYTALLLGVRTRLAQVASLVAVLSLHGRLLLFDNGGDVVLGLLCVWTVFLPTGRRWSVDALLRDRAAEAPPRAWVSAAVAAVFFQLALIYFFNAVHKGGATWRDGTAVHYVLQLDRLVTPFGVWLRERLTPAGSRVLTWSALATEWSLPWLLLSPIATRQCRRLAVVLIVMLHSGFGLCMNLGVFVPAMIAFSPNFIHGKDWDALSGWWRRKPDRARAAARRAERLSAFVGRTARWLSPGRWRRVAGPGPVVTWLRRGSAVAREVTVGGLLFLAGSQLLDENPAAHQVIDHHNGPAVAAAVIYLNLFQGWAMFSPDAFTGDLNVAVDAVTSDGRHVDPFNEAANPKYPAPGASIPPAMGPNWLFYQYAGRIVSWPVYNQAFQEWILRYPERTGRPADHIVSFKVFKVEDDSPPPGEREPRNARATLMFEYAGS